MESFGRTIAMSFGAIGVVVLLLFYKTAAVRWQKAETVHSMSQAYAESVLNSKEICVSDWKLFQEQLRALGEYRAEFAVFERRRFEGKNGRVYLYTEEAVSDEDKRLTEGSYIRIIVKEKENSKAESMLYGTECMVIVGGRVG